MEASDAAILRERPSTVGRRSLWRALAASGALETVAAIVALAERAVPHTLGTTKIDPAGERKLARVAAAQRLTSS